jgi:SARP family transcriptional regulator, regulator of embCAB operon
MNGHEWALRINLLGPLCVFHNEKEITPTAAKQRQILAVLALNRGQVVTVATLVEELWGEHPPRSYATTLQTYVWQLRKAMAVTPAAQHALQTRYSGYLLGGAGCQTDITEFDHLVRAGRVASEAGDLHAASEHLNRALRIWRGPALVDVPLGQVLHLEATALEQRRLGVFEQRVAADLILGRHAEVLGEMARACAKDPLNENYSALLVVALYQSGHVSRSLEEISRIRSVLNKELGIEPGHQLQRLQAAILSRDPLLESGLEVLLNTEHVATNLGLRL